MKYTTGNCTVDAVGKINFAGNVIPATWYQTIANESGKPNMLACIILSEIVYWYRPAEVRDDKTGEFIGYKKKFHSDLLQRSYESFSELYNVSKRQVKDAIVFLENIGVVKRVFRTIEGAYGRMFNNVMFISLNAQKLKELTYPDEKGSEDAGCSEEKQTDSSSEDFSERNFDRPCDEISTEGVTKSGQSLYTEKRQTNTKNTTKITDIDSNISSIHLTRNRFIQSFREQICYDGLKDDYEAKGSEDGVNVLNMCVEVATSVYFSTGRYQMVSGEKRPTSVVKKLLGKLTCFHMYSVIDGFLSSFREIKNIRAYLLTSMVNSIYSLECQEANVVNRVICGGG